MPGPRARPAVAAALVAVVAAGLASRRWPLPGAFAEYTGDALYAVAAYLAFALCLPAAPARRLATLAFGASALVEASQAWHLPALDAMRATRLGGLLLGHGFQIADLVAYAIGAAGAMLAEAAIRRPDRGARAPRRR